MGGAAVRAGLVRQGQAHHLQTSVTAEKIAQVDDGLIWVELEMR